MGLTSTETITLIREYDRKAQKDRIKLYSEMASRFFCQTAPTTLMSELRSSVKVEVVVLGSRP